MGSALAGLERSLRPALAREAAALVAVAESATPGELRRAVQLAVRRIEADDGVARLERHKRQRAVRTWVDRGTGMVRLAGQLDPETGAALLGRLGAAVERLFHAVVPPNCPVEPGPRNEFLRAHALLALTGGAAVRGEPGGPAPTPTVEMTIVIDWDTLVGGQHPRTRIEFGHDGIELPHATVRRMACLADIIPVLVNADGVVTELGRTARFAGRAQRRALRVMYPTCAVPGCTVRFDHCEPHHVVWFRHDGLTDLENLIHT